jgi:hypothetical protein
MQMQMQMQKQMQRQRLQGYLVKRVRSVELGMVWEPALLSWPRVGEIFWGMRNLEGLLRIHRVCTDTIWHWRVR